MNTVSRFYKIYLLTYLIIYLCCIATQVDGPTFGQVYVPTCCLLYTENHFLETPTLVRQCLAAAAAVLYLCRPKALDNTCASNPITMDVNSEFQGDGGLNIMTTCVEISCSS